MYVTKIVRTVYNAGPVLRKFHVVWYGFVCKKDTFVWPLVYVKFIGFVFHHIVTHQNLKRLALLIISFNSEKFIFWTPHVNMFFRKHKRMAFEKEDAWFDRLNIYILYLKP